MNVLFSILLFLHILGAALVFGLWVARFRTPTVMPGQFHAALLQLVTGLLMVGLAEMNGGSPHSYLWIGIKLVLAVVITVLAFIGQRKAKRGEPVSTGLAHAVGGLALINIAVATLLH